MVSSQSRRTVYRSSAVERETVGEWPWFRRSRSNRFLAAAHAGPVVLRVWSMKRSVRPAHVNPCNRSRRRRWQTLWHQYDQYASMKSCLTHWSGQISRLSRMLVCLPISVVRLGGLDLRRNRGRRRSTPIARGPGTLVAHLPSLQHLRDNQSTSGGLRRAKPSCL